MRRSFAACLLVLLAAPAGAGEMYGYVDEHGTYVVTDTKVDPRSQPYEPGDFERWALQQTNTPHAGLGARALEPRAPAGLRQESAFDELIRQAAARHGVPFSLVKAVVAAESGFNARAVSSAGAQGLMQLMPGTASDLGVTDPFDPAANVDGGTRYLAALLRSFEGERLALAAYNAGPSRVAKLGRVPDFPETRAYIGKVLSLRAVYARSDGPHRSR